MKAGIVILISEKVDSRTRYVTRNYNTEKAIEKMQPPFIIKTRNRSKLRIEVN